MRVMNYDGRVKKMFPSKESKRFPVLISNYLDPKLIIRLDADERDGALRQLVTLLEKQGKLQERDSFYKAIIEREKIISTGIGVGVAVPHAKLPGYTSFFIAIGIHPKGIPWDAIDKVPVRIVFMIGGPDDRQTEYLQLLSRITLAIKDEERRKKILQFTSPEEIIALFGGI